MDTTYYTLQKQTERRYLMEHNIDKSQSLVWHFFILQTLFSAKTNIIHPESIYESKYFISCKKYAKGYY